jgi:hypothetical protein
MKFGLHAAQPSPVLRWKKSDNNHADQAKVRIPTKAATYSNLIAATLPT